MSELSLTSPLPRGRLVTELRARLHCPPLSLQVIASDILGLDGPIDWVAAGPDRRLVLGFLTDRDDDLLLLGHALAQRAWAAARVGDWLKFAPQLDVNPDAPPRLLLLAPDFGQRARILAGESEPGSVELVRFLCVHNGSAIVTLLEPVTVDSGTQGEKRKALVPGSASFRTGLTDAELGLTPTERAEFDG